MYVSTTIFVSQSIFVRDVQTEFSFYDELSALQKCKSNKRGTFGHTAHSKPFVSFYALSSTDRFEQHRKHCKKSFDSSRYFPRASNGTACSQHEKYEKIIQHTVWHIPSKGKDNISFRIVYLFLPIGYISPAGVCSMHTTSSLSIVLHTVNLNSMAHIYAFQSWI